MIDAAKAGGPVGDVGTEGAGTSRSAPSSASLEHQVTAGRHHRSASRLSEQAQIRIGNRLRTLYDSVVQQPVPDRFRELIERLDAQEPKSP